MIKELTENQKLRLSEFKDKWLNIGLSTEPANKEMAKRWVCAAYKIAGLKKPSVFIWMDCPFTGAIASSILKNTKNLKAQVWDQVRDQVRGQVGTQVGAQVLDQVWAQVLDQVWAHVRAHVGTQVGDQVGAACYGSHDANWLGFYDYFREVLQLHFCEKLVPLNNLAAYSGWFWCFENAVVFSEKPTKISVKNKKLHCDDGPAVLYKSGFSVYALNGVCVSKEIVETPADQLDSALVLKEKNAEIRREIVRKIGLVRLCRDLNAKSIDRWGDYDLLMLDLKDGRTRPYLKMKNPSIDTIHIEGVHPDCKTVKQALAWRNQLKTFKEPIALT